MTHPKNSHNIPQPAPDVRRTSVGTGGGETRSRCARVLHRLRSSGTYSAVGCGSGCGDVTPLLRSEAAVSRDPSRQWTNPVRPTAWPDTSVNKGSLNVRIRKPDGFIDLGQEIPRRVRCCRTIGPVRSRDRNCPLSCSTPERDSGAEVMAHVPRTHPGDSPCRNNKHGRRRAGAGQMPDRAHSARRSGNSSSALCTALWDATAIGSRQRAARRAGHG